MTWFGVREGICVGMDGLDMDGFDWLCIFESLVGLEIGGVLDWLCFSYSSVWFFLMFDIVLGKSILLVFHGDAVDLDLEHELSYFDHF